MRLFQLYCAVGFDGRRAEILLNTTLQVNMSYRIHFRKNLATFQSASSADTGHWAIRSKKALIVPCLFKILGGFSEFWSFFRKTLTVEDERGDLITYFKLIQFFERQLVPNQPRASKILIVCGSGINYFLN